MIGQVINNVEDYRCWVSDDRSAFGDDDAGG